MCTSASIIDISLDECQSIQAKSGLTRRRPLQIKPEKAYLLDVRLLADDDCGALDFVCNVAEGEPATIDNTCSSLERRLYGGSA
ncbi:hypothetical protein BgiBS90_034902 [Biomphalaria glabrata]|nr:hypothetical protein BgiBS90_034902 [Biomphalaria glabrata]